MHTRAIGNKGEDIAVTFLERKGFAISQRNFQRKWGEIDVIAKNNEGIHFFEVKSVTFTGVLQGSAHRPEDNVHGLKVRHIRRMVETYLAEKGISSEIPFQFHVLCVYMNLSKRTAQVKWIKNLIL